MKRLEIVAALAVLVLVAGAVSDAWAGCSPSRRFRSQGKPNETANVKISVLGTDNNGNQIGRMWDSDDANNSNSGLVGPNFGSQCPPSAFWLDQAGDRKIDEFHGSTTCSPAGCPADNFTVVVEDFAEGGPPGIGISAYYAAFMVHETPSADRWWDYGLVDSGGSSGNLTLPMLEFPAVQITSEHMAPGAIVVAYTAPDQSANVHTWDVPSGAEFPTGRVIAEWQLMRFHGVTEPGRLRTSGWVMIDTFPYVPGDTPRTISVPLPDWPPKHNYLAFGIGFNGGAAGVIDSVLVGPAVMVSDPTLADPEFPAQLDRKRDATQLNGSPGQIGGRR